MLLMSLAKMVAIMLLLFCSGKIYGLCRQSFGDGSRMQYVKW